MIEWHHLGGFTRVRGCRYSGWHVGWEPSAQGRCGKGEEKNQQTGAAAEDPRVWHVWLFLAPTFNKRQMLVDIAPTIYIYIYYIYKYVMSGGGCYFDTFVGVGRLRFPWSCRWFFTLLPSAGCSLGESNRRKRRSQKWLLCEPWVGGVSASNSASNSWWRSDFGWNFQKEL